MKETAYCNSCRSEVAFGTKETIRKTEMDGHIYEYPVRVAICDECGKSITYKPYQEDARYSFADCVRKEKGLVSLEMVQALPEKYHIGKRPLSVLLGWGDATFSRFANGLVPSPSYSKIIEHLYNDPKCYMKLLLSNRDRISSTTFRKSYFATQEALDSECPGAAKLISLANYLKRLSENTLDRLGVQKMIYYVQGFASCLAENPIISRAPKAWSCGPVYGEAYHYDTVSLDVSLDEADSDLELLGEVFTSEELEAINNIYFAFRPFSNWTLAEMTHSEAPWLNARARAGAAADEKCDERIKVEDIKEYFLDIIKEYGIDTYKDVSRYANAKYQEIRKKTEDNA